MTKNVRKNVYQIYVYFCIIKKKRETLNKIVDVVGDQDKKIKM